MSEKLEEFFAQFCCFGAFCRFNGFDDESTQSTVRLCQSEYSAVIDVVDVQAGIDFPSAAEVLAQFGKGGTLFVLLLGIGFRDGFIAAD